MFATNATSFTAAFGRTAIGALGTVIFAGACLLGATAPAQAATLDAPRTQAVHFNDLNLASDAGRKALDARVRFAARSVCDNGRGDLAGRAQAQQCINAAVEAAQPKMAQAAGSFKG